MKSDVIEAPKRSRKNSSAPQGAANLSQPETPQVDPTNPSANPATVPPPKMRPITTADRREIARLRKHGHGCTTIGKLVNRDPKTVWRTLLSMGIDTNEFRKIKDNWSDLNIAGAARLMERRNRVLESLTDEDIEAMDPKAKCTAAYQLSLATGATVDQAPKVQVNVQVNYREAEARIAQIEARIAQIRARQTPQEPTDQGPDGSISCVALNKDIPGQSEIVNNQGLSGNQEG